MADPPRPPEEDVPPSRQDDAAPPGEADGAHPDEPHADEPSGPPAEPTPATPQAKAMTEKSELYPADNPAVTKHVDVLQAIITRLANNSASCKTWCLTLVGAVLSLAGATKMPVIGLFVIVPIVIFRYLDIKYLAAEKSFRDKYNAMMALVRNGTYTRLNLFDVTPDTSEQAVAAAERHARASWSVKIYRCLIRLYWAYAVVYALYLIAWFIDWKFGCFGGFFAPPPPAPPQGVL
jgi:uncharacterized membrane protein